MNYCPVCKSKADGKVCSNCGAVLELDQTYQLNPYDKQKTSRINREDIAEKPQKNYFDFKKTGGKAPNKREVPQKALYILLCLIFVIIVGLIIAINNVSSDIKIKEEQNKKAASTQSLMLKGEKYLKSGNYEDAEKIYKELMETSDNKEAQTLYKILYNYNMALRKLDDYNFESASRFFDKIPKEYEDYAIAEDIQYLSDEIARFESNYEIFESVEKFFNEDNISGAKAAIEILDEDALSKESIERLKEIKEKIEKKEKTTIVLSEHDAEDLLRLYCDAMVKAINENNFDLVLPYIYKDSKMYADQKSLVEKCVSQGIKEEFNSFELVSLNKTLDTVWQAEVKESETVISANGEREVKNFKWTYTIEYIDSEFYLTNIK